MKKRLLACVLTLGLLPTLSMSTFATETYDNPVDLITDVVSVALTDITSSTMTDAISEMQSKITTDGDKVLYDGSTIGYWYDANSAVIYTDDSQSTTVVNPTAEDTWEVDPAIFEDILSDINANLVENVVPTTDDWSKIIGKYDVTLGDITIPADHWIELDEMTGNYETTIDTTNTIDVLKTLSVNDFFSGNRVIYATTYAIDDTGALYIQDDFLTMSVSNNKYTATAVHHFTEDCTSDLNKDVYNQASNATWLNNDGVCATYSKIRIGWHTCDNIGQIHLNTYYSTLTGDAFLVNSHNFTGHDFQNHSLYNIADSTITLTDVTNTKSIGIILFEDTMFNTSNYTDAIRDKLQTFFNSQTSSRKVVGNTTLRRNLAKLETLSATDTIVFASTGWSVNGTTDIGNYVGSSVLTEPGSADIDGLVDVDALIFKVVVPTTLPMLSDIDGIVTVASNAELNNLSNSAVTITDIDISENPESGWTLVDENPSAVRGDNEFTFTTSLNVNDTIARDDVLPFTYTARLSPLERDTESIDLVTLTLTFDWAI